MLQRQNDKRNDRFAFLGSSKTLLLYYHIIPYRTTKL